MNFSGVGIDPSLTQQLLSTLVKDRISKVVVGAVVVRHGKVLLLKRTPGEGNEFEALVELPSGGVDEGEELDSALIREVYEETGLHVTSFVRYLGSFDYSSGSGKRTRQFNFLVNVADGKVKLAPAEHDSFFWVKPHGTRLKYLNISDEVKRIITSL